LGSVEGKVGEESVCCLTSRKINKAAGGLGDCGVTLLYNNLNSACDRAKVPGKMSPRFQSRIITGVWERRSGIGRLVVVLLTHGARLRIALREGHRNAF
jgi:hypothetical protein